MHLLHLFFFLMFRRPPRSTRTAHSFPTRRSSDLTYPLVAHHGDAEARAGGRIYLLILLGTSIVLFLPAFLWTLGIAGTLDFTPGGILAGRAGPLTTGLLLALFAFGIGKAALMPVHRWLPAAMVAPTPVSALLHAVAVVKAGVFAVLKIVIYIFGPEHLLATGASEWLVYVATFSLLAASIIALTRDNLKARLAYSTVSQLGYIVLGAAVAPPLARVGARQIGSGSGRASGGQAG